MFNFLKKNKNSPLNIDKEDEKTLAASLYKQNRELGVKNKTLSLLSKLYEISILSLESKELADRICKTIQEYLSFEIVGVLLYDNETNTLMPLTFAYSERLVDKKLHINEYFNQRTIPLSGNELLKKVVEKKEMQQTEQLNNIWGQLLSHNIIKVIESEGHIKSSIVYPLMTDNKVLGIMLFSLNRSFADLITYEKESIKSFINVVAVALDKSLLNEQLKEVNMKLRQIDEAKSEFISIASHQLRTPMTVIKGFLSMIFEGSFGKIPAKQKDPLTRVQQSNERLLALIESLLNISRIESGRLKYNFEKKSLRDVVFSVYEELKQNADVKRLKYKWIEPKEKLPDVTFDEEKIRQVLINFIDNAIKYTQKGGLEISLVREGDNLVFRCKDTGMGLTKDEIVKLFEKFVRGKRTVLEFTGGTGLGLYVGRMMVEVHGGKAWAESPGKEKGSTFAFSIPINPGKLPKSPEESTLIHGE